MRARALLIAAMALLAGCGGGDPAPPKAGSAIKVSSPDFHQGQTLAKRFTCSGAGTEPRVQAAGIPAKARELVLVVSDPDAPQGTFYHLTRFAMAPGDTKLTGGTEGDNSYGRPGWTPPCPPKGDPPHHYVFSVYALDHATGLKAGAAPGKVTAALGTGVASSGRITARFGR